MCSLEFESQIGEIKTLTIAKLFSKNECDIEADYYSTLFKCKNQLTSITSLLAHCNDLSLSYNHNKVKTLI